MDMVNLDSGICPEGKVKALVEIIGADEERGARDLENLLRSYAGDARLHFLKGSLLAGRKDYEAARASMRRAVDLAPDYGIARFQLGLLLLSSGAAHAAQEVWGPLYLMPADNFLHLFAKGLSHMIRDDFPEALRLLRQGIDNNVENPAMNRDMQLVVAQITDRMRAGEGAVSSVDFLLQQSALKSRH